MLDRRLAALCLAQADLEPHLACCLRAGPGASGRVCV
jgi:hypothetical protein